jgi:hypothetical protein
MRRVDPSLQPQVVPSWCRFGPIALRTGTCDLPDRGRFALFSPGPAPSSSSRDPKLIEPRLFLAKDGGFDKDPHVLQAHDVEATPSLLRAAFPKLLCGCWYLGRTATSRASHTECTNGWRAAIFVAPDRPRTGPTEQAGC